MLFPRLPQTSPAKKSIRLKRRQLRLELLERRELLVSDWTNPFMGRDVNNDGFLSPVDAFIGIKELNHPSVTAGGAELPGRDEQSDAPFFDVNGDQFLSPIDVLVVINTLNIDPHPPTIAIELENDTAPGGAQNEDLVTSDPAIHGEISIGVFQLTHATAQINERDAVELEFDEDGHFDWETPLLRDGSEDGTQRVRLTFFDETTIARAAEFSFELDTTGPDPIALVQLLQQDDSGSSNSDGQTNLDSVSFVGADFAAPLLSLYRGAELLGQSHEGNGWQISDVVLEEGNNPIAAVLQDAAGNESVRATFSFEHDSIPPTGPSLVEAGVPGSTSFDIFFYDAFDPASISLDSLSVTISGGSRDGQTLGLASVEQHGAASLRVHVADELRAGELYTLTVAAGLRDIAGNVMDNAADLPFSVLAQTTLQEISPRNGEDGVGLEREIHLRFSHPVRASSVNGNSLKLLALGQELSGFRRVSSDGLRVTFFPDAPWPSSAEVRIELDGDLLQDLDGNAVDVNLDGVAGGQQHVDFQTLSIHRLPDTDLFGYVYDAYQRNQDGSNVPVVGATIRVDALPELFAITDENGYFLLEDVPAPEFFVHIDGTTATSAPAGAMYPNVGKPFHSVPGQSVQLQHYGEVFDVYLPPMAMDDLQSLSTTETTLVGFGDEGKAALAEILPAIPASEWDKLKVTFEPGSAIDSLGTPATQATVIPVPPERLPAPLPANLNPQLVVSIQAVGATNFDTPAPVTFPNLDDLPLGDKPTIWSFDHDRGAFRAIGVGTVVSDGNGGTIIQSDAGTGILAPGWHFTSPPLNWAGSGTNSPSGNLEREVNQGPLSFDPPTARLLSIPGFGSSALDVFDLRFSAPPGVDELNEGGHNLSAGTRVRRVVKVSVDNPELFTIFYDVNQDFRLAMQGGEHRMVPGAPEIHLHAEQRPLADVKDLLASSGVMAAQLHSELKDGLFWTHVHISEKTLVLDPVSGATDSISFNVNKVPLIFADLADDDAADAILRFADTELSTERERAVTNLGGRSNIRPVVGGGPFHDFDTTSKSFLFEPVTVGGGTKREVEFHYDVSVTDPVSNERHQLETNSWRLQGHYTRPRTIYLNREGFLGAVHGIPGVDNAAAHYARMKESLLTGIRKMGLESNLVVVDFECGDQACRDRDYTGELRSSFNDAYVSWETTPNSSMPNAKGLAHQHFASGLFRDALFKRSPVNGRLELREEITDAQKVYLFQSAFGQRRDTQLQIFPGVIYSNTDNTVLFPGQGPEDAGITVLHEFGHSLGLVHSDAMFERRFFNGNGGFDFGKFKSTDLMASGTHSSTVTYSEVTKTVMRLALELEVGQNDVLEALEAYARAYNDNQSAFSSGQGEIGAVLAPTDSNSTLTTEWDFAPTPASSRGEMRTSRTISLLNSGDAEFEVTGLSIPQGSEAFQLDAPSLPRTLQPGETLDISVHFAPSEIGTHEAFLRVDTDIADTPNLALLLTGEAIDPNPVFSYSVDSDNSNFGGVELGAQKELTDLIRVTNLGAGELVFTPNFAEDVVFELPAEFAGEMRLGYQESISIPIRMQPTQLGLQRDHLRFATNDPTQPIVSQTIIGTGIPAGGVGVSDFVWGDDYVNVNSGASSQNTISDGGGYFELAVPPQQEYSIAIFDPASGYIATQSGALGISGGFSDITSVLRFRASEAADQDGDGLPDDIEKAIGSNLAASDSDEDGIDDFTEIQQGLNPLDGAVLPLGVVSSIELPGPARELHIDASPSGQQLAYVATGGHGLAIVEVTSWQNPILLGQLDLPGNASDVELLPEQSLVVIAAGNAGLQIVDVSDPMQPSLIKTIDQPSSRVEVIDNVAYLASGESLITVDLETDEVSGGRSLGGGAATDIAVMGRHIFTMTSTGSLQAHEVDGIAIRSFTPLALDHAGGKIFAGDGVIYAAASGTFFRGGMSTVDASSPQVLQPISGSDIVAPFVGPGTAILVNGSGIGLLVGDPEFDPLPELRVLDTNDLTQTDLRIGGFMLPDVPHAVGLAGGVAFVADQRGLKVVNYMQRDNDGQAPEVTISTTVTDAEPAQDGLQVLEGTTFPVHIAVTDDVQVREVQLLVNGQVVQRDLQFPWDFETIVPDMDVTTEMEVLVRAIDTGGNSSTSNRIHASIVQDGIPPSVESTVPATGDSLFAGLRRIAVRFSEPISESATADARFHLRDASDGQLLPQAVHLRDDNRLAVLIFAPLPPGEFDLVVDSATVTDRAGNPLGSEPQTLASLQLIPPEVSSYYPFRTFVGPSSGTTLANADLNEDGFLDVVAGGSSLAGFTVSMGDEDGNLSQPVEFPLTIRPSKILLVDLTGDGVDDVVALSSGGMVTSLGNGDGTFQAEQTVTAPGFLYDFVADDFNNDGKVDLVVSDANSNRDFSPAVILLGVGDGTFEAPSDITTSIAAQTRDESVSSGDFNGDGNLDLVLTHRSPGWGMIVLQGNGDGSFTEVARHATENTPISPAAVDLDGDGDLDIAMATMFGNNIELFFNDGVGVFSSRSRVASGRRTKLRIADMNNDNHPDLLAVSGFTLTQWLGVGDGSFGAAVDTSALGQHFEPMDLDNDGNLDLLYAGHNLLGRVLGKGDGSFPSIAASGIAETSGFTNDVDLDGDIDVATVSGRTIKIYENNGDAGFTHSVSRAPRSSSVSVSSVGFGDLNADGHPDLIAATTNNRTTFGGVEFWLTDATGTYSSVASNGSISSWPRAMEVADINADGVADVVVAVGRELSGGVFREVNVLLGNGAGGLAAPIKMGMPFAPYSIATGDFNKDGNIDIVTGNNANSISLFLGNGDGNFQPRTDFALSERARQAILVKDLDGDENLDVVVSHPVGTSVLLGNGDGTFESPVRIGSTLTHRVFAEDVTQDGVQDLILQNGSGPIIYPGVGDGTFGDPLTYGFVTPWMVADFDGDQDPDIINGGQLLFHQGGNQAFALRLASESDKHALNETVRSEQLTTIVDAAIDRFVQVGLSEEEVTLLRSISFQIADLGGDHLGFSFVHEAVVWLDIDGAGAGWFVDETPQEDSEFGKEYDPQIHDRADLLTVVLHEMGHILGQRDTYKDRMEKREPELMDAFLDVGTRLLPTEELVQNILLAQSSRKTRD